MAGRSRRAAPEVDRPGAVAEHLHGRRVGPEARRDLQAGLAARPEDHLLPAHHQRHLRREEHRRAQASSTRCRWCARAGGHDAQRRPRMQSAASRPATSSSARSTTPIAKPVSECDSHARRRAMSACAHRAPSASMSMRCCNNEARGDVNQCLVFAHNTPIIRTHRKYTHAGLGRRRQNHRNQAPPRPASLAAVASSDVPHGAVKPLVERACSDGSDSRRRGRTRTAECAARRLHAAPRQRRRQTHHQRPDRRQPAGAVQVQVGVGEVPRHLRQPLDAARGQHVARHRDLEGSQRPDRRRAPHRQAQPRLLRHRRFAGRQQHRAGHLPPHHGARVPPVPAAPGLRGSDPHPRLPVHRRDRWAWTRARSSTPTTRSRRSATRTSS